MSFFKFAASISAVAFSAVPVNAQEQNIAELDIETIVVTGTKTAKSIQDVPASVRVMTSREITDEGVVDVYEVLDRTVNAVGTLGSGFSIRGIDAFSVSGGGGSFLASVYVDGAALPQRAIQQGPLSTWDVAQVEILRGPQSTLQGRNALAGALVVRTKDPAYEWEARAKLGWTEHGGKEIAFAGGGALVDDQVAFRVSGEWNDLDGYIDNITRNEKSNYKNDWTARAKVLVEPGGLDGFRALFSYIHNENEAGNESSLVDTPDKYSNRQIAFDHPTNEYVETDIGTLELSFELSDYWNLQSITSYNRALYTYSWDADFTAEPIGTLADRRVTKTFTQELLAKFDYDRLTGVVGAYYSHEDDIDRYGGTRAYDLERLGVPQLLVAPVEMGGLGLPQALADQVFGLYAPINPVLVRYNTTVPGKVSSIAAFADFTFNVTDKLDFVGGFRVDRETQELGYDALVEVPSLNQFPDPADFAANPAMAALITGLNARLLGLADSATGIVVPDDQSFSAFLPKFGLTYHFHDDISASFVVQQGYRSGGVGTNVVRSSVHVYDPEYTWNYELSFRSQWFDRTLTANANFFYLNWRDQQITVQLSDNDLDTETVNAGKSTVYGLELELNYQPEDNVSLYGGLGYSKTAFDEFLVVTPTETFDLAGREFKGAPRWTANLGGSYRSDNGFFTNVNVNYQSDSFAIVNPALFNGVDPKDDARILVTLRAGYEWDHYGLYVTASNLFNEKYVAKSSVRNYAETLGAPRQIGVRLEVDF